MCGKSKVYFGSSVTFVNGVHIYNHQNYYCAGAITEFSFNLRSSVFSFNFSFDVNVVSNIADIRINIEIIINIADRG
jgi:hypothetical protein